MKRMEESAARVPQRDHYNGQECDSSDGDAEPVAKCAWGKPERTGAKPAWYLNLFH